LPAAAEDASEKQPLGRVEQVNNSDRRGTHPAVQGRVRGQVGPLPVNRGPPPRHLLPQRLRPSPGRKLHPLVILPPHIRKGTLHTEWKINIGTERIGTFEGWQVYALPLLDLYVHSVKLFSCHTYTVTLPTSPCTDKNENKI
jgi:hypothetical protein